MQEAQNRVSCIINVKLHHHIVSNIMRMVGDVLLGTLLTDETPAYNLYGLLRFHADLMVLQSFAFRTGIAVMEVRQLLLNEPFCPVQGLKILFTERHVCEAHYICMQGCSTSIGS